MERKLRFLNNELDKAGIELRPGGGVEAPDPQGVFLVLLGQKPRPSDTIIV